MMKKSQKKEAKKKLKNAQPNKYDGIKFRSKLETYTYKKLKEANIYAEYEKHRYELLPAFVFNNKKVRAITYLPDFVGENFIIECKGFPNDAWPIREKLMLYYLSKVNADIKFYVVHNQKEVNKIIQEIHDTVLYTTSQQNN